MRKAFFAVALACVMAIGGTAIAATIVGTNGDDSLRGTGQADTINARRGDDTVRGRNGDDLLKGKDGGDELFGQNGNDVVNAGAGDDDLWGGSGPVPTRNGVPDIFKCGPGDDHIFDFEYDVDKIVGPGGVQEDPHASTTCEQVDILYLEATV